MKTLHPLMFVPILVFFLLSCLISKSFASPYIYHDLGTLGGDVSVAYKINNNGLIVGRSQYGAVSRAFSVKLGEPMINLGTLGVANDHSVAYGINASGQIVGASTMRSNPEHAFLINPGGSMEDLGTLRGLTSVAYDINNSGQIVGYSSYSTTADRYQAFIKNPDEPMKGLGTLGGTCSYAFAINDSGHVVGTATNAGDVNWHAFLKKPNGPMIDLGTLGGLTSEAWDINSKGQIVGFAYKNYSDHHAFLLNPDEPMKDLGTLGGTISWAFGINDSCEIVGYAQTKDGINHAFLANSEGVMEDLNNLVDNLPSGISLIVARDINNDGWIVGSDSRNHAFLLIPVPAGATVVPLPSAVILLGSGLVRLVIYKRRRQ